MHRIKSPIFIFSLPRSGSTLLQRILMNHSEIASLAEPWVMLPLVYATRKSGIFAEYNQDWSSQAVNDFISVLPGGKATYQAELRDFVIQLYSKHCPNGESYFLDKTPRYYLIIEELAEIFPDAKFIFLFRNPVEILSSILSTWCNSSLHKVHSYTTDLHQGPKLLTKGFTEHQQRSHRIDYRKLLENPRGELDSLCRYLGLSFEEDMLENFPKTRPRGNMGDSIGTLAYTHLTTETLHKWIKMAESLVLKKYFIHYINSLEGEVVQCFGYEKDTLISEIQRVKTHKLGSWKEWYFWWRGRQSIRFKLNLLSIKKKLKVFYS